MLSAIGVTPDLASAAIRMSLGTLSNEAAIDRAAEVFAVCVNKARGMAATGD